MNRLLTTSLLTDSRTSIPLFYALPDSRVFVHQRLSDKKSLSVVTLVLAVSDKNNCRVAAK
jgi:hypothetical protein